MCSRSPCTKIEDQYRSRRIAKAYLDGKDTVPVVNLREIYIYPPVKFKNKREQARYTKLVRDVKRTLPYAKMVYETLIETYEYIETLPDENLGRPT